MSTSYYLERNMEILQLLFTAKLKEISSPCASSRELTKRLYRKTKYPWLLHRTIERVIVRIHRLFSEWLKNYFILRIAQCTAHVFCCQIGMQVIWAMIHSLIYQLKTTSFIYVSQAIPLIFFNHQIDVFSNHLKFFVTKHSDDDEQPFPRNPRKLVRAHRRGNFSLERKCYCIKGDSFYSSNGYILN